MYKKKVNSLDKSYKAEILFISPDKYKNFENIVSKYEHINTMGSCNSYTPASFKKDSLSIELKKFNRIIDFDKKNQLITESGIQLSNYVIYSFIIYGLQIPGYPQ